MAVCWKCLYEGIDPDRDTYCTRCGVLLENFCPEENCSDAEGNAILLDAYDRFCYQCGSESKFMQLGYFDSES